MVITGKATADMVIGTAVIAGAVITMAADTTATTGVTDLN